MYRAKIVNVSGNYFSLINNNEGETIFQSAPCRDVTDAENQAFAWADKEDIELEWTS